MKSLSKQLVFTLAAICAVFITSTPRLIAADTNIISAVKGDKLYTQFNFFYEKNVHRTTNYRAGTFLPVNTEVTFVKANKKEIDVKLPGGKELKIVNVEKYSGEDINGIFFRTFAKTAVDLSRFSAKEKKTLRQVTWRPA